MKNFFRIAAIFFAFGLAAAFASCSNASGGGDASAPSPAPTPTYTVTFNSNGGSEVTSQTVTSGQTATKPSDPSKDHFNFVEWCSDQACQTAFDFATPITDDITLYAKWSSLPVYVVTFVLNGGKYGSSSTYTQNVESGSKAARPASGPTKDDYVSGDVTTKYAFDNWYADADCGTLFDFDATTISGPTTIYAKWSESKYYTVTFDLNGGKYGTSGTYTQSVLNGSKVTRPASNPTKDDNVSADVTIKYTLDNWYADSEFGALFDFNTTTISGPTTVYAKWNETKYYAVKIASGIEHGSVSSDATEYVAAGTLVTLTAAPNLGYEFVSYTVTDADSNPMVVTNGKFTMPASPLTITATFRQAALTLEATKTDTKVVFENRAKGPVTYRVNAGEVQTINIGTSKEIILENIGDKVSFYGNNATYTDNTDGYKYSRIRCYKTCYIYGNIMSLVDSTNYENAKTLTENFTFKKLFETSLIDMKPDVDLLLPATTLKRGCYQNMFYCCGLTRAPTLPATKLEDSCYESMFWGNDFKTAPDLPATGLAESCYENMFRSCKRLERAPVLPVTSLWTGCYSKMFQACESLEYAPALPATELTWCCYSRMFYGCNKLKSVTCLATDISNEHGATKEWLEGVATTGTFTKNTSMSDWASGASGIPEGWTVVDYQE